MLILTGGDCFERPDLVDLIEYAVSKGLHVSISPSVTPLFTRDRVRAVQEAGVSMMSMSLDGGSARPTTPSGVSLALSTTPSRPATCFAS
ncbi:radical SAM domain heme biosynthesis protein [Cutibacterium acnes JCM 18920]|nr:radical SAM domain heme biosynthesis protein [Cutibacterium acnes JCM 18920]